MKQLLSDIISFIHVNDIGNPEYFIEIKKLVESIPLEPTEEELATYQQKWEQLKQKLDK